MHILVIKKPFKNIFIGIGIGSLWLGLSIIIIILIGSLEITGINEIDSLGIWILAAFLNVIMQELLFKGYMYQLIKTQYNLTSAIVVTTLLFTAMHGGAF